MRKIFGVAGAFFVSQLATLMLFQSGNLILAHNLGPRYVVSYQITWLLAQYVTIPQQLISASVWATIGEAYAKDDIHWIRRLVKRYSIAGLVICGPLILLMLAFGGPAVELWAGPAARPSRELLYWMAAWATELVLMHPIIAVLGGTGRLREYSLFTVAAAAAAMTAGTIAVRPFGPVGVIAAIVMSYLFLAVVPAAYLAAKTLRIPLRQLAHA